MRVTLLAKLSGLKAQLVKFLLILSSRSSQDTLFMNPLARGMPRYLDGREIPSNPSVLRIFYYEILRLLNEKNNGFSLFTSRFEAFEKIEKYFLKYLNFGLKGGP